MDLFESFSLGPSSSQLLLGSNTNGVNPARVSSIYRASEYRPEGGRLSCVTDYCTSAGNSWGGLIYRSLGGSRRGTKRSAAVAFGCADAKVSKMTATV